MVIKLGKKYTKTDKREDLTLTISFFSLDGGPIKEDH
jgi:hypothetical protein